MLDETSNLLKNWPPTCVWGYLICVIGIPLGIRALLSAFKASDHKIHNNSRNWRAWREQWWKNFCGTTSVTQHRDSWIPYALGVMELSSFPVLISVDAWIFIGAWLSFKTLAQWNYWGANRQAFNRFLVGTGLILMSSVLLAALFFKYGSIEPRVIGPTVLSYP